MVPSSLLTTTDLSCSCYWSRFPGAALGVYLLASVPSGAAFLDLSTVGGKRCKEEIKVHQDLPYRLFSVSKICPGYAQIIC